MSRRRFATPEEETYSEEEEYPSEEEYGSEEEGLYPSEEEVYAPPTSQGRATRILWDAPLPPPISPGRAVVPMPQPVARGISPRQRLLGRVQETPQERTETRAPPQLSRPLAPITTSRGPSPKAPAPPSSQARGRAPIPRPQIQQPVQRPAPRAPSPTPIERPVYPAPRAPSPPPPVVRARVRPSLAPAVRPVYPPRAPSPPVQQPTSPRLIAPPSAPSPPSVQRPISPPPRVRPSVQRPISPPSVQRPISPGAPPIPVATVRRPRVTAPVQTRVPPPAPQAISPRARAPSPIREGVAPPIPVATIRRPQVRVQREALPAPMARPLSPPVPLAPERVPQPRPVSPTQAGASGPSYSIGSPISSSQEQAPILPPPEEVEAIGPLPSGVTCCICLDEDIPQEAVMRCQHAVCADCSRSLRTINCPACRRPIEGGYAEAEAVAIEQRRALDREIKSRTFFLAREIADSDQALALGALQAYPGLSLEEIVSRNPALRSVHVASGDILEEFLSRHPELATGDYNTALEVARNLEVILRTSDEPVEYTDRPYVLDNLEVAYANILRSAGRF